MSNAGHEPLRAEYAERMEVDEVVANYLAEADGDALTPFGVPCPTLSQTC